MGLRPAVSVRGLTFVYRCLICNLVPPPYAPRNPSLARDFSGYEILGEVGAVCTVSGRDLWEGTVRGGVSVRVAFY